jgi:hypothetical protein
MPSGLAASSSSAQNHLLAGDRSIYHWRAHSSPIAQYTRRRVSRHSTVSQPPATNSWTDAVHHALAVDGRDCVERKSLDCAPGEDGARSAIEVRLRRPAGP